MRQGLKQWGERGKKNGDLASSTPNPTPLVDLTLFSQLH